MIPDSKCPVCSAPAILGNPPGPVVDVDCFRCGKFSITLFGQPTLADFTHSEQALLSAYISENAGVRLDRENLPELKKSLRTPPVPVRAEKLFVFLAHNSGRIGEDLGIIPTAYSGERPLLEAVAIHYSNSLARSGGGGEVQEKAIARPLRFHYRLMAVSSSEFAQEVSYLITEVLDKAMGVIHFLSQPDGHYEISPKGWEHLSSVQRNPLSAFGFVAMSFKSELRPLYEKALSPGVLAAGYHPLRVDEHEHTNRIDDEIIALIRRARFCVADVTLQNDGAYFEAGYALGLGIPVFWTCKKGENMHFDTRQFNTLFWTDGELKDLAKRLQFRIERVIGRGPRCIAKFDAEGLRDAEKSEE